MSTRPSPAIDPAVLREAAEWMVLLQSGEAQAADHAALAQWRQRSPGHQAAWARAEGTLAMLGRLSPRLGRDTLRKAEGLGRRRLLRLGLTALAVPVVATATARLPWEEWRADQRTATGERRAAELADGTRLFLDTDSAVDVAFGAEERRLVLHAGKIMVTTGHEAGPVRRPFYVDTPQGRLRALGTRFSVYAQGGRVEVMVFEGAVEVHPARSPAVTVLQAGQATTFSSAGAPPAQPGDPQGDLWVQGMMLARHMRVGVLVAELARYHRGVLRCDPAVADLVVSGAFPVADTVASLDLLEKSLPLRVARITPFWLTVRAR